MKDIRLAVKIIKLRKAEAELFSAMQYFMLKNYDWLDEHKGMYKTFSYDDLDEISLKDIKFKVEGV